MMDERDEFDQPLLGLLSEDSTIALGQSSSSLEFEDYLLNEKVDLVTTTFGVKPPRLPLREERISLGVETVFKAKGVGWQGVRKKYCVEKKRKSKPHLPLGCSYVISWDSCRGSNALKSCLSAEEESTMTVETDKENGNFKALTYEEYLAYLRRCQEKTKSERNEHYLELELETTVVKEDSPTRRQRLFTRQFIETRDDSRHGISYSSHRPYQEMRDFPYPNDSLSSNSDLAFDFPTVEDVYTKQQRKRVSFATVDQVMTIPRRGLNHKTTGGTRTIIVREEIDVKKDQLIYDTDIMIERGECPIITSNSSTKTNLVIETKSTNKSNSEEKDDKLSTTIKKGGKSRDKRRIHPICNKSAITNCSNDDEISPKSRVNISRGKNLLDAMYTKVETSHENGHQRNKPENYDEVRMLKRPLIDTDTKSTNSGKVIQSIQSVENVDTRQEKLVQKMLSEPQSNLHEQQAKDTIDSISLAKLVLAELRSSLDEEEDAISRSASFGSSDITPSNNSTSTILNEVNGGKPLSFPRTEHNVVNPVVQSNYSDCNADDQYAASDLRREQAKRTIESIGLAKMILDEMRSSLDEEEKEVMSSASLDSHSSPMTPALTLANAIMMEVKSIEMLPVPIHTKEKLEPAIVVAPEPDHTDIMKVDSNLREEQIKRSIESIGLAKIILDEVRSSLDDQETETIPSSFDIAHTTPAMSLANAILNEVNNTELLPALIETKKKNRTTSAITPELTMLPDQTDIMKVDSGLREEQVKRNAESISLSKRILDEVRSSLNDEEDRIIKSISQDSLSSSPSSFGTHRFGDEETDTEISQHRSSIASMNHPAELAQRRAQDIRARHQIASTEIAKSLSKESEDSWSQPNGLLETGKGLSSWIDENESLSISSIEKTNSTSVELARRLIEEARIRHQKISFQKKEEMRLAGNAEPCCANPSTSPKGHGQVQEIKDEEAISIEDEKENAIILARQICSPDHHEILKIEPCGPQIENMIKDNIDLSPSRNLSYQCGAVSSLDRDRKHDPVEDEPHKLHKRSMSSSVGSEESAQSFASLISDDSIDNLRKDNQHNFKHSTCLARRLLLNAKKRLEEVKRPLPCSSPNTSSDYSTNSSEPESEAESFEGFQVSADFAKHLFREAFTQNGAALHRKKSKSTPKGKTDDVARRIMDEAGFSDLFYSSEEGSFEKILRDDVEEEEDKLEEAEYESIDYERSTLESIKEEDGKLRRTFPKQTPLKEFLTPTAISLTAAYPETTTTNLLSPDSESSFQSCISSPRKLINGNEPTTYFNSPLDTNHTHEISEAPSMHDKSPLKIDETNSSSPHNMDASTLCDTQNIASTKSDQDQYNSIESSSTFENDEMKYTMPQSFSMLSCNSSSTNGFSIKSSKSIDEITAEFEMEESMTFAVNELNRINSMLEDAESSCHSSNASSDDRDALFFAKQSKEEIAALARAIERKVKAEENSSFETAPQISESYSQENSDDGTYKRIRRVGSPLKQDIMAKSPAMDQLIAEVNELCNQIEKRIDNIMNDTKL